MSKRLMFGVFFLIFLSWQGILYFMYNTKQFTTGGTGGTVSFECPFGTLPSPVTTNLDLQLIPQAQAQIRIAPMPPIIEPSSLRYKCFPIIFTNPIYTYRYILMVVNN